MFVPYKKYVITLLFLGKEANQIDCLVKSFNYFFDINIVPEIFTEICLFAPEDIRDSLKLKNKMDIDNPNHVGFLKHFEVFELYHYLLTLGNDLNGNPEYFKFCQDAIWIAENPKIMAPVNLFIFNGDTSEDIVNFIKFKYKKRISVSAINLYKNMFWDCQEIDAEEAIRYCLVFHGNTIILKENIITSEKEIKIPSDYTDLNTSDYVKWKMGYRQVKVPNTKEFFEDIKKDCVFTYQEIMNRQNFITTTHKTGTSFNDKENNSKEKDGNSGGGIIDQKTIVYKDPIDARYNLINKVLKVYSNVEDRMPTSDGETENFFDKIRKIEIIYEGESKKILRLEDNPGMLNDIKDDMR